MWSTQCRVSWENLDEEEVYDKIRIFSRTPAGTLAAGGPLWRGGLGGVNCPGIGSFKPNSRSLSAMKDILDASPLG
jgi:hypothetical protein